jgi:FSR family fosmidomycin resistance protein-like MFS transporter
VTAEPNGSGGLFGLHRTVLLLAATHFVVDGYGNILAPLLPLLITNLGLSLFAAGTLQMCFNLASSVSQLAFGHIADRWRPGVLLIGGPLLGVTVITLIGLAPNSIVLAGVLILGGLGGAAFHPPAAALVHQNSGDQRGLAMSFHITSGTLGQALAPLAFAPYVQHYGISATPLLMVPAVVVLIAVLLRRMPVIERLQERHEAGGLRALRPYARPLSMLYFIVVLRTLTAMSFYTFVPVMLTRRGLTLAQAGAAVSVYLCAVGLGGFFGGPIADRVGPRRVIILSLVSSIPFLALAPLLSGWMFVVTLAIGGFLLQSTLPVNVTFAQTIAPISAATVSSLMMGFAWGLGGLIMPLVGMLADRIGIDYTLMTMSAVPLAAACLALPLPTDARVAAVRQSSGISTIENTSADVADQAPVGTD